jgi:hypothetical protein
MFNAESHHQVAGFIAKAVSVGVALSLLMSAAGAVQREGENMRKLGRTAVMALFISGVPFASAADITDVLNLSQTSFGGSGCPQGTAYLELLSDRKTVRLTLNYEAEAGGQLAFARKGCQLAIPAALPDGKRLVVSKATLAGGVDLPAHAGATLALEVFGAGGASSPAEKKFQTSSPKKTSVKLQRKNVAVSGCGGQGIVRAVTSAIAQSNSGFDRSTASVYTLLLTFKLQSCSG